MKAIYKNKTKEELSPLEGKKVTRFYPSCVTYKIPRGLRRVEVYPPVGVLVGFIYISSNYRKYLVFSR